LFFRQAKEEEEKKKSCLASEYERQLSLTLGLDNGIDEFFEITFPALFIKTMDLIRELQTRATIATI